MAVHDPRVSHQLARLGGVYRDPARVERDASILLKSSVGQHLQPITAVYVDSNNGVSSTVLVLQGTIAIHFRGNTYQLLVDMYIISGYPMRPPVCYVRLADPSMYLKPNHKHVGSDGKIYLPYLSEWNTNTHHLVELVVAMSSVFSAEPPVFSRPTPPTSTPPPPLPEIRTTITSSSMAATSNNMNGSTNVAYSSTMNGTSSVVSPASYSTSSQTSYMNEQQQLEIMLARDAAEANEAREVARKAEEVERMKEEDERRQKQRDIMQVNDLRNTVLQKVRQHCYDQGKIIQIEVQNDWKHSELLNISTTNKLQYQIDLYNKLNVQYKKNNDIVIKKTSDIKIWLEENDKLMALKQQEQQEQPLNGSTMKNGISKIIDINKILIPSNQLDKQMIELNSENMAMEDLFYFLNKSLYNGNIDCNTHLKLIRNIAKQQFFVRALMIKIHHIQQHNIQRIQQQQNQQSQQRRNNEYEL